MKRPLWSVAIFSVFVAGCAGNVGPAVRSGTEAYDIIPAPSADAVMREYVIGPLDVLDISVFNEPEVSSKGIPVDASGNVSLPLIGRVRAAGLTATALSDDLQQRYASQFYVNPQVSVVVTSSVAQRVTVQGEVKEPGIYDLRGPTTLLDTLSLAKGESEDSRLSQVVILRVIEGKRMAALFDVNRIRRGEDPDPAVMGRDVVIVGHSYPKQIWHDMLRAAPLLNVFAQF